MGDQLSGQQLKESIILNKSKDAFSRQGKIGKLEDPNFFHRIDLIPNSKPFNEALRPHIHVEETRKEVKKKCSRKG